MATNDLSEYLFIISGYLRGLNGRNGTPGIPGGKGEPGIDGQDGESCPTEMCILPPKTTVEYITTTMLTSNPTTVPLTVTDEFMERRSDETGSFTGNGINKKVSDTWRLYFQRLHPTYNRIKFSED